MVFTIEGFMGDLDPATMRRLAEQLRHQRVTL